MRLSNEEYRKVVVPHGAYHAGKLYGRSIAAFERRYGLLPMTKEEAIRHAYTMSGEPLWSRQVQYVEGFSVGYNGTARWKEINQRRANVGDAAHPTEGGE